MFNLLRKLVAPKHKSSTAAFEYLERDMIFMGWKAPKGQWTPARVVLAIFIIASSAVYFPTGVFITFFVDLKTLSATETMTVLQVALNTMGFPLKLFILRLNLWRKFYKIKELLDRMDERCIALSERNKVHRWVTRCNMAYLSYQFVFTSYTISTFFIAISSGVVPWNIYNPFIDSQKNTMNLWIASFVELIPLIFIAIQTWMVDGFPLLLGLVLRAHIKLLKQRVDNLCSDPSKSDDENHEDLVKCIEDHNLILEYAALIRPFIEPIIFVQFLLVGLILGISLINLLYFADAWAKLPIGAYIILQICQTFPFCCTCDLIREDCEILAVAIFHSSWNNSNRRYKASQLYFLQNAQRTITFTAGSIFSIGLSTNLRVAKLAFSVVTFVNQLGLA
ncbi:blast:Odorant receptor 98a [Drosophila guanche]|uniref:Odorant receptor n=1 Tax=Drosophila guanche TaxID=7266 RepID=A0A3B0KAY0_DROGU|nr:blast:Odorant receptor 98a [Drosophila guanche]